MNDELIPNSMYNNVRNEYINILTRENHTGKDQTRGNIFIYIYYINSFWAKPKHTRGIIQTAKSFHIF